MNTQPSPSQFRHAGVFQIILDHLPILYMSKKPLQVHGGRDALVLARRDPAVPRLYGRAQLCARRGNFPGQGWERVFVSV